jgi:cyclophilin family peptidyl-prolyl cis-trans isomerase
MKVKIVVFLAVVACCGCQLQHNKKETAMPNPTVTVRTTLGDIQIELDEKNAPLTVKNFLQYVDAKHYNDTIFHRVIDGFMVQGGGMTADMKQKSTGEPIHNEADHRLRNATGTIAMARTSEVHSATAQFFINVADNAFLDYRNPTPSGYGYCVFGKVVEGMKVVNAIKTAKTTSLKGHENVPVEPITILEIIRNPTQK